MKQMTESRMRSEDRREQILAAAVQEFGEKGFSGARTEAIAKAAGVNKALIYYYFKDKEGVYRAVLRQIMGSVTGLEMEALGGKGTAGECLLRWALQHFDDRIIVHREHQKLFQQEMIRAREGMSDIMPSLVKDFFFPLHERIVELTTEGVKSGELYPTDPGQIVYAVVGPNVFYFMSAPILRQMMPEDPLSPEQLRLRRERMLAFLGQALFRDRDYGQTLAKQVLAQTPMPPWASGSTIRRECV